MAEAEDVDQRTEAQALGALGDRRQKHAGRRRHAERRRMVFGDMVGVKAAAVIDFGELQPAFIEFGKARGAAVDVIEDSKFHVVVPCWSGCCYLPVASGSWASIRMKAILQTAFDRLTQA